MHGASGASRRWLTRRVCGLHMESHLHRSIRGRSLRAQDDRRVALEDDRAVVSVGRWPASTAAGTILPRSRLSRRCYRG